MKLLRNKTVEELKKEIDSLEKAYNTARMEKCKYKEIINHIEDNEKQIVELKKENKFLKKRNKKLIKIEKLFKNKKNNLKEIKKIIKEDV